MRVMVVGVLLAFIGCMDAEPDLGENVAEAKSRPVVYQGSITSGATVTGSLSRTKPYHLWSFDGVAGDRIDVALSGDRDTYVAVMRDLGGHLVTIASNDNCNGTTTNSCVTATIDGSGRYAIMAASAQYATSGRGITLAYSMRLLSTCGGAAGLECQPGLRCDYIGASCGTADPSGVCVVDVACSTADYNPVCGCDGVTYTNSCYASLAGTPSNPGGCLITWPRTCGGLANQQCDPDQVCDYSSNTSCAADNIGTCEYGPNILCTSTTYDPVCGCDGVTYNNDCLRRMALVAREHPGVCN